MISNFNLLKTRIGSSRSAAAGALNAFTPNAIFSAFLKIPTPAAPKKRTNNKTLNAFIGSVLNFLSGASMSSALLAFLNSSDLR